MSSDNHQLDQTEQKSGKNTGYFKVMLIFCVVMAVLVTGLYYLFNYLF